MTLPVHPTLTTSLKDRFPTIIHFPLYLLILSANSVLNPDEYLTAATLQWCQQRLAQLSLATPPVASDFIPYLVHFRVLDYYKSLIHTVRVHYSLEEDPRLELAAKPRDGYGWDPRHEVAENPAEG
jgi:hypothetical protein